MIEPSVAFTLFDKALSVLGLIREGKKRRTDKTDQALLALLAALAETRVYMSELKSGKCRSQEREMSIARLWHTASVPLREIDKELAERCFMKGSYWLEPEAWDNRQIDAKNIAIESMFEATRKLLIN